MKKSIKTSKFYNQTEKEGLAMTKKVIAFVKDAGRDPRRDSDDATEKHLAEWLKFMREAKAMYDAEKRATITAGLVAQGFTKEMIKETLDKQFQKSIF